MDFFVLTFIFICAGLVSIYYFKKAPEKEILKQRLPNKISLSGVIAWLIVGLAFWLIFKYNSGFTRIALIFTLFFSLLVFETFFLLILKFIKSNLLTVILSFLMTAIIFGLYLLFPSFTFRNAIIILATLGASTLLIKLDYLKKWTLFTLAILWTGYDIYATLNFYPQVLVPVTEPQKTFFFPAVITGSVSLGSGDFIFLVLFILLILRNFGPVAAFLLLAAETLGLLIAGFFLSSETIIPFLAVMTPVFLLIYLISYIYYKKLKTKNL